MTDAAFLSAAATIEIVSGEGTHGTAEVYTGARTVRAIKSRLTKEKCGGDRWARAEVDGRRIYFTKSGISVE